MRRREEEMKRQKVIELDRVETPPTKGFNIDWDNVLVDEEVVPDLEIVGDKTPPREPAFSSGGGDDSAVCVKTLKDSELDDHLKRQRSLLSSFGDRLPDNGERIRSRIGNLEYEKQRRFFRRAKSDTDECQILVQPKSSDVFKQANTATGSKEVSRSPFSAHFSINLKVEARPVKLFNEESQDLGRESWKRKDSGVETTTKQSNGWRSLPRLSGKSLIGETNFYSGFKDPKGNRKHEEAFGNRKRKPKESSPYLLVDDDDDDDDDEDGVVGYDTPRELSCKASLSQRSSRRKTLDDDKVINLDEEEPESPVVVVEEALELPEGLPGDICYPSRDDPDLVQVSIDDLKCLSPRECLTSPVINFYIRFLQHQVFAANQTAADCHFFNTFFYKKLIEAVSYKGNDKEASFVRLRRWWKGFDLFRKSYIFIPIHEDRHWSLVIICIPDKEDESGLTILHLDSLGFHPTRSILNNVKRFLIEEWSYLNQDASLPDLPISEKIWRDLPDRINEAEVKVPQQKNDFDCGLFVLFFIQRFIEDAPQRLKLQDLGMIHKEWFKPSEASALRIKIWNKLIELFGESVIK
ncbi:LOW QUALITY PROTEIN: ubiquitin-like-specific protease 1C [Raphanus sativus]|uniref:LOW QUALITY PROTEIN: ubiquitin-like-specific protease 1C n=1 Tax=Raphanus sativus TaxID=3726 RepID=A0A6J0KPY0_RAPSA|nr:LOW QUALITY PROTEIN: ubiquitin-like-specific protease 1C [Raphanus sativus]